MDFRIPRLYAIIDPTQTGTRKPAAVTEILIAAGVRLIQYRDKFGTSRRVYEICSEIARLVHRAKGTFIVNDRADLARLTGADGVHIGQDDLPADLARRVILPDQCVGISTHTRTQLEEAAASSSEYIAMGPIFSSGTKANPDPVVGLKSLREVRRLTRKPLVAIGGITLANAASVIEAGADSVAVIHDLLAAEDIGAQARKFLQVVG